MTLFIPNELAHKQRTIRNHQETIRINQTNKKEPKRPDSYQKNRKQSEAQMLFSIIYVREAKRARRLNQHILTKNVPWFENLINNTQCMTDCKPLTWERQWGGFWKRLAHGAATLVVQAPSWAGASRAAECVTLANIEGAEPDYFLRLRPCRRHRLRCIESICVSP